MNTYRGMLGLGDNIYQRAIVRELGECQLITPWPQLYVDLPVRCIEVPTLLRTQRKNMQVAKGMFQRPLGGHERRIGYAGLGPTMVEGMCQSVGLLRDKLDFSLPSYRFPAPARATLIVRPATVRSEWPAASRNPKPEYLAAVCDALRHDFHIVSIADLKAGEEWLVGEAPFAHETYHHGELAVTDVLGLVSTAAGAIGGVGWLLPACIGYQTPMLLIYGGWGAHNGPQRVLDPRMPTDHIVQVVPDNFCMCQSNKHDCDKTINPTTLEVSIERFKQLALARAIGVAA